MEDKTALLQSAAEKLYDTSEEIRYVAVRELARSETIGAVPLLMQVVADSSYRIREEALQGICSFPSELIFPRLESFLRNNENANLRNAAMEAFPRYGEEATPYLTSLLQDSDEELRIFTAVMLGEVRDASSVHALIEALNDSEDNVKHAAAESLGMIGDARAVMPLINCLRKAFWIQYPAIMALGEIGDPKATEALISLLDDEMLREAVIEALGKIGDVSVVPVLARILSRNETSIRNCTIAAMVNIQSRIEKHILPDGACLPSIRKTLENGELIDHLLKSLREDDLDVKKNSVIALGWLKEARSTPDLIELLSNYELEEYAVGSIVSIGETALPELLSALDNEDPKIKSSVIRCIGWVGDVKGIEKCIPFLIDEDYEVRMQAISAMSGGLKSKNVEDALLDLIGDPDYEIQLNAVETLSKSISPTLTPKLISTLSSEEKPKKLATIQLLGRLESEEAFEPLKELLSGESDEIRAEIYRALSSIRPGEMSIDILAKGLADESPTVRRASADCLASGPPDGVGSNLIPLLNDPDPEVRISSIETLGRIGDAACIEHLIGVYAAGDRRFKLAVVRVMGNIHDKVCTQFLADILRDADSDVKRSALESLGKIRDKKTVSSIVVALDDADWSVRSSAIEALERIGDRRCISFLMDKLDDPEDIIKKRTIMALGRLGVSEAVNSILPLIYDENLQLEVIDALEKLGIPDFDFYYDFFKRSNTRLKCHLVDVLGRLINPDALEYLVKILEDEFFTVRCRAAKALGEFGDRKAIPSLLRAQQNDPSEEVQKEAALALKRLDSNK